MSRFGVTIRPVWVVVAGLALFALGLAGAARVLPEWRIGALPDEETFVRGYAEAARRLGLEPSGGAPSVRLNEPFRAGPGNPWGAVGASAGDLLLAERRPVLVRVSGSGRLGEDESLGLNLQMGLDGRVWDALLERPPTAGRLLGGEGARPVPIPLAAVLRSGEVVAIPDDLVDGQRITRAVGEEMVLAVRAPVEARATRLPFPLARYQAPESRSVWSREGTRAFLWLFLCLAAGTLCFVLAVRRRASLGLALRLALPLLVLELALLVVEGMPPMLYPFVLPIIGVPLAFTVLGWAAGESWTRDLHWSRLRAGEEDPFSSLDALVRGRLGRRVGAGVALGLGIGAAIAGVRLGLVALGAATGWALPASPTVDLPLIGALLTPITFAVAEAVVVLLAWAAASFLLPGRLRVRSAAATVVAALVLASLRWDLIAFPADLALALGMTALLVAAWRLGGGLGLLVASLSAHLFPAVAYGLQAPGWIGWPLPASAGFLALLGLVAVLGSNRRATVDESVEPPTFLRRLDQDRRVAYEMDLLARMQRGLLPATPPRVAGWELAASSTLAHEVGGDFYDFFETDDGALWIAAGDVAGHGSSCSIVHAMTKATLASLIRPGRTPAEVLGRVDRVLRGLETGRLFTALALVRLDPATGEARYANAGYPYPLLVQPPADQPDRDEPESERVVEVEMPGLPAGGGPARIYRDREILVPPGGALVLCSDGLYESFGSRGGPERPYGFSRPRRVLEASRAADADGMLGELVADWRRFVGPDSPEDDTTLLVVRRVG